VFRFPEIIIVIINIHVFDSILKTSKITKWSCLYIHLFQALESQNSIGSLISVDSYNTPSPLLQDHTRYV